MKYTVMNSSLKAIATTNSFREALVIADDGCESNMIYRETGDRYTVSEAAEIVTFVNSLLLGSDEGRYLMTYAEALYNLCQMSEDDIELPRYMTSEVFCDAWNEGIQEEEEKEKADPAKKQYMVQIRFDGEVSCRMMTGRELADHYETNAEAGIGEEYAAFDVSDFGHPVGVNVWEIVHPIIEQKRWMQEEYDDYCNELRYADWN